MKIAIFILTVLLLGSNAWWLYKAIDNGVSVTYLAVSLNDTAQALEQTLSLVPLLSSGRTSRDEVIAHLEGELGVRNGFEKEGVFCIGKIGLIFDDHGKLVEIQRAWD